MPNRKRKLFDNTYVLMSILLLLWGSLAGVSKLVLQSADSFQFMFFIYGSAFLIMTPIFLLSGGKKALFNLSGNDFKDLVLCSLFSFGYYFFYMKALESIPAVEASMLNYLFPLFIIIFSIPLNHEKLDKTKFTAIILGFIGTIIILLNGSFANIRLSNIKGDLFAIGGAVSWGIFSNLGKRNKVSILVSNYVYIISGFILSAIMIFAFSQFHIPGYYAMAGLIWIGISNIVLTFYIWFKSLKNASITTIASLTYLTPFITLILIMILTGEKITIYQLAGLIVIIAGLVVCSKKDNRISQI